MTGSLPSALRCYGLYKGPFCIGAVVIGYPMNDAMYSVGCMTNTAASSSAPYQQESSLRDRARQAIATGDQAAARALLHQLFVEEPDDGLSASLTDAVVATASAERDVAARERYQQTQRELHDVLGWLDTADLDDDDLGRLRRQLDRRATGLEAAAKDREADQRAMVSGGTQRRHVGAGWLEVKHIPRPNGRITGPYLYYRARARGRLKSVYIGKLT
jgi:hypothetical protein